MIKSTDLRLGNLIYTHDKITPVYDINGSEINHRRPEVFTGIPLTEEWLIKAGFEQLPHFTVMNSYLKSIGRNRYLSIGSVGTPNLMVFICEHEGDKVTDTIVVHNYDYDKMMYVHQLQNLYYSLTGEELTFNL